VKKKKITLKYQETSYTRGSVGFVVDGGDGKRGKRGKYPGSSKATKYYTSHYDAGPALWLCSVGRRSLLNLCKDGFEYFACEGEARQGMCSADRE
jgi:hypothetical protein